jgi:hypothetical protein
MFRYNRIKERIKNMTIQEMDLFQKTAKIWAERYNLKYICIWCYNAIFMAKNGEAVYMPFEIMEKYAEFLGKL